MRQRYLIAFPWEAIIWIAGVAFVAFPDPAIARDWSLCFFELLGITGEGGVLGSCPGCGLGHAVAYLFRGAFLQSMDAHLLGLPAVVILLGRSIGLIWKYSVSVLNGH
ncbi:MAG: DUF2752 domain-containing protein [Rhodothermales bacterium]